jgi:hypothetical protein
MIVLTFIRVGPNENWRGAIEYVNEQTGSDATVVAWVGGFITRKVDKLKDETTRAYLRTPFAFYDLKQIPMLLPLDPQASSVDEFLEPEEQKQLQEATEVWSINRETILASTPAEVVNSSDLLINWGNEQGLNARTVSRFGNVTVIRFVRNAPGN